MIPVSSAWMVEIVVPKQAVGAMEEVLSNRFSAVSMFEDERTKRWNLSGVSIDRPNREELETALALAAKELNIDTPKPQLYELSSRDWVDENQARFPPVEVGRIFVRGSHYEGEIPPGRIGLEINAATAFGSGEHQTTRGCLLALQDLKAQRFSNPLDVGCGSGILSMAMAKLWHIPITAVDIDPESVRVSKLNMELNELSHRVRVGLGNGYHAPIVRSGGSYDLIVANILLRPLCKMATRLRRNLAPGGTAVLSGFFSTDLPRIESVHRRVGLRVHRRYVVGDWAAVVLKG